MRRAKKIIIVCIASFFTVLAQEEKVIIFVVGMHRSGTSAMTGVLSCLDVYLGENLDGATLYNAKGHFEHHETKRLNRLLLDRLHTTWRDTEPLTISWDLPIVQDFKTKIKEAWQEDLLNKPVFAVKDPCLCLLLPLYLEIAKECGYEARCIAVMRNPYEIAKSLEKRNKIPVHKGILLVRKYITNLQHSLDQAKVPTLYITFNNLLTKTSVILERLQKFLPMLAINSESAKKVHEFLDVTLKHHWYKK